jgi:F-type H+-transporting ATPase subunit b
MFSGAWQILAFRLPLASGTLSRVVADFHVEWPLLIAQIFNFSIVAFLLHHFAFRPLQNVVDERRRKIADGLRHAEAMRTQLAQVGEDRDRLLKDAERQADGILDGAQREALETADGERRRVAAELDRERSRAAEALERERAETYRAAEKQLKVEAAALAEKILRERLPDNFNAAVLDSLLKE